MSEKTLAKANDIMFRINRMLEAECRLVDGTAFNSIMMMVPPDVIAAGKAAMATAIAKHVHDLRMEFEALSD